MGLHPTFQSGDLRRILGHFRDPCQGLLARIGGWGFFQIPDEEVLGGNSIRNTRPTEISRDLNRLTEDLTLRSPGVDLQRYQGDLQKDLSMTKVLDTTEVLGKKLRRKYSLQRYDKYDFRRNHKGTDLTGLIKN